MECYGHFYASIKISIFKTLRKLDTTDCDLTDGRVTVDLLPVGSHSRIITFCLP